MNSGSMPSAREARRERRNAAGSRAQDDQRVAAMPVPHCSTPAPARRLPGRIGRVQNGDAQALFGKLPGRGHAHDTAADDDHVEGFSLFIVNWGLLAHCCRSRFVCTCRCESFLGSNAQSRSAVNGPWGEQSIIARWLSSGRQEGRRRTSRGLSAGQPLPHVISTFCRSMRYVGRNQAAVSNFMNLCWRTHLIDQGPPCTPAVM